MNSFLIPFSFSFSKSTERRRSYITLKRIEILLHCFYNDIVYLQLFTLLHSFGWPCAEGLYEFHFIFDMYAIWTIDFIPLGLTDLTLFIGLLNLKLLSEGNEGFIDHELTRFFHRFEFQIIVFIIADNAIFFIIIVFEFFRKLWEKLTPPLEPHVELVDRFSDNETFVKYFLFDNTAIVFLLSNNYTIFSTFDIDYS